MQSHSRFLIMQCIFIFVVKYLSIIIVNGCFLFLCAHLVELEHSFNEAHANSVTLRRTAVFYILTRAEINRLINITVIISHHQHSVIFRCHTVILGVRLKDDSSQYFARIFIIITFECFCPFVASLQRWKLQNKTCLNALIG